MRPRSARLLDDLIGGTGREGLYRLVRDGRSADLGEVLGGLEARLHRQEARTALVAFTSLLIAARPPNGFDATRAYDRRKRGMLAELAEPNIDARQDVDDFVARVLQTVRTRKRGTS